MLEQRMVSIGFLMGLVAASGSKFLGLGTVFADDKAVVRPATSAVIVTGHHHPAHDWEATTPALIDALEQQPGEIDIRVVEDPEFLALPELDRFDVVVLNYCNWERPGLSAEAKANFLRYLRDGGGLAIIHFANGAWHFSLPDAEESDWPEWRTEICRRVWDHSPGQSGHDPHGPFRVEIVDSDHSITQGLDHFDTVDELYFRQQGDRPIHVLASARSSVTEQDEPMAFVFEIGRGRVFQTVLGHDAEAIRVPGAAALMGRGTLWAAGVDLPPSDPEAEPSASTLAPGRFGQAIDTRLAFASVEVTHAFHTPPITVECWARLNYGARDRHNILLALHPEASSDHWKLFSAAGDGTFRAHLPGYEPAELDSKVVITDGQWHYLAMTFDGQTVCLYVDAKPVGTAEVDRIGQGGPMGPLRIGAIPEEDLACVGLIDEVRISNVVRPIQGVPNAPLPIDEHTLGCWRFDRDDLTTVQPLGPDAESQILSAWTPTPASPDEPAFMRETDDDWIDDRFRLMDTGPALGATVRTPFAGGDQRTYKGLALKVGDNAEGTVLFDRGLLRYSAGWTGGFLKHSNRRFGLLNTPTLAGPLRFATGSRPGGDHSGTFEDPRVSPSVPLLIDQGRYNGLYLHGSRPVLRYTMGTTEILDAPWFESSTRGGCFTRTIKVGPLSESIYLLICELPGAKGGIEVVEGRTIAALDGDEGRVAVGVVGEADLMVEVGPSSWIAVRLDPSERARTIKVHIGDGSNLTSFARLVSETSGSQSLDAWTSGGPARYPKPLVTRGELSTEEAPYVLDTLTIPDENPYNALFFLTAIDFLPNGDIAVCSAHGDVWIVSGVDESLAELRWRRFATGLYQPMGLKVLDGVVHVLERGQLTRLHDLNGDGEADYYENLSNTWDTASGEHSYDTCLEVDSEGNFYFFKTGDAATPTGGCLLKVGPDGSALETLATGFRHPIGIGMGPQGQITAADQQGVWVPASRVDWITPGGFYGHMPAHHRDEPPDDFEPPVCWIPRLVDNSSGGQVWVNSDRWGPLEGQVLHFSWGMCRMLLLMSEEIDGLRQGGVWTFPLPRFLSGPKTGGFRPLDGQLYVCGLNGWQTAADRDGCLQRVRYTGGVLPMPVELNVLSDGLQICFSVPVDPETVADDRFEVELWNYRWTESYGSPEFSVSEPDRLGRDSSPIAEAILSVDGRKIQLILPELQPVMQMQIRYRLRTVDGRPLEGTISNTIHRFGHDYSTPAP